MKARLMRGAAGLLAVLLVLAWFFLPWEQETSGMGDSTRGKQELNPGESLSWTWIPEDGDVTELGIRLSGLKKAQGLTLTAELTDSSGRHVASVTRAVADMGEEEELILRGTFGKKTVYTLTVSAAGEGNVKLRGEETEAGFYPLLRWSGRTAYRNPALIYFALGCVLTALVPLRNGERRKERKTADGYAALMPWGTFILITGIGLMLVFYKPAFTEGYLWQLWDEEIHWTEIQGMLLTGSNGFSAALGKLTTWAPGYLPMAIGAGLAAQFTSHMETLYRAGTAFGVLAYALLAMGAVRHAPRFKASFMVAAVLPAHLFLASGMTYDTVVIGCILLGAALILEVLDQNGEMTAAQGIFLLSVMAFGTVAKPAYSVVLLLVLMLPAKKLGSGGRAWLFRLLTAALLVWCLAAVVLPGAYDSVRAGDGRYEGTDAVAQIGYLNSRPQEWVLLPLRQLYENRQFLLVEGIPHWAYLGTNLALGYVFAGMLLLAAPLAVCGEEPLKRGLLKPGRRILFGGTAVLAESILILTQYAVSSPVGGGLRGMQARYILPVWILLALALMLPEKLRNAVRKAGPAVAAAVWAACLGTDLWYAVYWLKTTGCI